MPAQPFDVGYQVRGGVGGERGVRIGGVRGAAPASALVEQHDAVRRRVEQPAPEGSRAGSRPAVQDDGGLALRVSAGLPVHAVAVADVQRAVLVRLDGEIEPGHVQTPSARI